MQRGRPDRTGSNCSTPTVFGTGQVGTGWDGDVLRSCTIFLNRIFNRGGTSTHYTCTCILVVTTLRMTTWLAETWRRALLEKPTGSQVVTKFPAFYVTRRFITAFTSPCHLSLSWASSIQSTPPNPTSWRSILILSSDIRLDLPSGLFPSGFPTKNLCTPLFSPIRATRPARDYYLIKLNPHILEHMLVYFKQNYTSGYLSRRHLDYVTITSFQITPIHNSLNILSREVTQFHKLTAP